MGDCAVIEDNALPPVAQVANQQAQYLAKQFNKGPDFLDKNEAPEFEYMHRGSMAQVASWGGVVDTTGFGAKTVPGKD